MKDTFYITTTLPYVNADPHMGHALEFVHADIIARHQKLLGKDVFFNTGTDEHGIKIYKKAEEIGVSTKDYVDTYASRFKELLKELNISEDNFIRTTDRGHKESAQAFWKKCEEAGDIYKKNYKSKYCVGCELEKTDSELVDNKCPLHPNLEIEIIEEENYFFKFSNYQKKLLKLYEDNPNFVLSRARLNEIRAFVERGLQDFSISRLKEKMPWGVTVPGDEAHIIYVWFDALVNYISAIGWPDNIDKFEKWWSGMTVQIAGKDNLRQQSAMWQAMLMSAGLPPTKTILIHGFINIGGQKMSKSLGNVIDPREIIKEYGADALRYFLSREVNTFEDSDMTMERFKEAYNANLANGLGNLVSRVMKMGNTYNVQANKDSLLKHSYAGKFLENFEIQKAADEIWEQVGDLDSFVQKEEPFKKIKTDPEKAKKDTQYLLNEVYKIGYELQPFMPETAKKIMDVVTKNKMPEPLFKRAE